MYSCGSCDLGDTAYGILHLALCRHHKVSELINNNYYLRQYIQLCNFLISLTLGLFALLLYHSIILEQTLYMVRLQPVVTLDSFVKCPAQRTCGLQRLGNNRDKQMRYIVVYRKFHLLRVNKYKLDLVGRSVVQNT